MKDTYPVEIFEFENSRILVIRCPYCGCRNMHNGGFIRALFVGGGRKCMKCSVEYYIIKNPHK